MLKTTGLFKVLIQKVFRADDNKVVGDVGSGKADETFKNLSKYKKSKNKKSKVQTRIETTKEPMFLTPDAKEIFNSLKKST